MRASRPLGARTRHDLPVPVAMRAIAVEVCAPVLPRLDVLVLSSALGILRDGRREEAFEALAFRPSRVAGRVHGRVAVTRERVVRGEERPEADDGTAHGECVTADRTGRLSGKHERHGDPSLREAGDATLPPMMPPHLRPVLLVCHGRSARAAATALRGLARAMLAADASPGGA
jgi:hypothetical protein